MDKHGVVVPNDLSAILDAGGGDLPPPVVRRDLAQQVMEDGIGDGDDDSPPAIHLGGSLSNMKVIADPSRDQVRMRARQARMVPPGFVPQPQGVYGQAVPGATIQQQGGFAQWVPPPMPAPMTTMGINMQAIDLMRNQLLTSHGAIPLSESALAKIRKIAVDAMRDYFADSVKMAMEAYGMRKPQRAKPRRKRKQKLQPVQ